MSCNQELYFLLGYLEGLTTKDVIRSNDLAIVKNIIEKNSFFDDPGDYSGDDYYEDETREESYGKYAGSYAQDEGGFSDDVIDDAFEGDPDNYWNID